MLKFRQVATSGLITVLFVGCSMVGDQFGSISPGAMVSAGSDVLKAATLSDEEMTKLCHDVAVETDQSSRIALPSSPYGQRLARLVTPYQKEDGLNLNFKVYIDPEVNAFSLADGTVRVHSGLMDKMNDQELLSVIGHEIGHIKSGHSKVRMQRAYAASAALKATSSSLRSGMGNSLGSVAGAVGTNVVAGLAAEVLKAQFSQSDETEADEYGVHFLHRHKVDPNAMVEALLKLDDQGQDQESSIMAQFTSSHPGSKDRAEHIKEVIASLGDVPVSPNTQYARNSAKSEELPPETVALDNNTAAHEPASPEQVVRLNPPLPHSSSVALGSVSQTAAPAGWYIQMAAFSEVATAEGMKNALAEREERAKIQPALVHGTAYQRVLVGPYPTKQNAAIELSRVLGHGIFDGEPFVRHLPE